MTLTQADIKRLRSLSQKKYREEHERFLVQGRKVVVELLSSDWKVECILASEDAAAFISEHARRRKVPVQVMPTTELDRIGTFERGNELIAIAHTPKAPAFRAPAAGELMLALDGVRDPRNMGSLLRIADWFGVKRILCGHDCMELFNPKAVQSTMGSLFRVEVRRGLNLADELREAQKLGTKLYIADADGRSVFGEPMTLPGILVLGSESHGYSDALQNSGAEIISIPRIGKAESLNVAMAATAFCMELTRQRLPQ